MSMLMIRNRDMGLCIGRMGGSMRGCGGMGSSMAGGGIGMRMGCGGRGSGLMGRR